MVAVPTLNPTSTLSYNATSIGSQFSGEALRSSTQCGGPGMEAICLNHTLSLLNNVPQSLRVIYNYDLPNYFGVCGPSRECRVGIQIAIVVGAAVGIGIVLVAVTCIWKITRRWRARGE
ncbi:hypothetical protein B0H15DRAFT_931187 [Mycena belliarum]|uniref:Uncharacterized protein n=1 Tax=Mycena belliarum TaxID=1033014 RepID=A0AAD6XU72_9AGAR|nr:hypothetical protein B0H15DRAFT_931187 [Mycena belliae]